MEIKLTNTMSRKKEVFRPFVPGKVGIYTCGPTVYNYAHIGNLRAYVFADTLKKMFRVNGYDVQHVMNITDVGHLSSDADEGEDKIEKSATREGKTVWEIADFYTQAFLHDLELLQVERPNIICPATQHIPEIIAMIRRLEERGLAYVAGGNVYFDTSKFPDYGRLARLNLSKSSNIARVEKDPNKRSPHDFVLWFTFYKYSSHAMLWDSPWGRGFPGWHIECSAMASKYLGERFDIHTGGIDHIPVHHTNEIAQSEGALGHQWVSYWLHNDFLIVGGDEKMAKSGSGFLTLQSLIDRGYDPLDYRYYLLGAHYRSPLEFTFEGLDGAKNALKRLRQKFIDLRGQNQGEVKANDPIFDEYRTRFLQNINDDLNTPKALAVLWGVVDSPRIAPAMKIKIAGSFDQVLGIDPFRIREETIPDEVRVLIEERSRARTNHDWARADTIREELLKHGYEVQDSKSGPVIKRI